MKYSQFNSIVPIEDKYVLFNTFTNNAIVLDPLLRDLINAAKEEGIENLKDYHPTLLEAMITKEFVIDDNIDEVDKVKIISRAIDNDDTSYHLTINPTMNCNFKCWYCYETHIKASRMNEEISNRVNSLLSTLLSSGSSLKNFVLAWFGGEPLLYYNDIVLPIIKHLNTVTKGTQINKHISFTSNGFLINDEMIESFKENEVNSLQITLDGYGAEHDLVRYVTETRGSYDKIIENVLKLVKNQIHVRLRINFTSINIKNAHRIIEDIAELSDEQREYLNIDFHRVWQDGRDNEDIFEIQLDKFREAGFTVLSNLSMNNVKDSCYADKRNSAVINYNGDVFKCTARDFTTAKRQGYISESGELIWENNNLERRMSVKFNNKPCLTCKLLPVCNGGCSQHAIENFDAGSEYCVHEFDEKRKDEVIIQKVKELLEVAL
jgi:uncharacterized protein